jgi:anti-sigma B factor antagonist
MAPAIRTRVVEHGITVVEFSGRLSLGNILMSIESSIKKLIEDGSRKMVLDLSTLNFCDSAGIGVLVASFSSMERRAGKLRAAGAQGPAAKTFQVVHLERILPMDADVAASCRIRNATGAGA